MTGATQVATSRRPAGVQERKYKCAYCARAFSRSEHRSRHERSHTKERPFKCLKCRSTFVRRDLLLRHDRTVHAKDGGIPLHSEVKRRAAPKPQAPSAQLPIKPKIAMEPATLDHLENNDDLETAAALITELHHAANAILVREEQQSIMEERLRASNPELPVFDRAPYPSMSHLPWDVPVTPTYSDCDQMSRSSSQSSAGEHWDPMEKMTPADQIRPTHPNSPVSKVVLECTTPTRAQTIPSTPTTPSTPTSAPLSPPLVESEAQRQAVLENIKEWDIEKALENFRLPSRSALNRYLSAYFTLFHHHFPFLHTATFEASAAQSPLLLAVLSVGALYTFEREQAFMLHVASKQLATSFLMRNTKFSSRNCPLWNIQTYLLNMMFASWSGDASGLEWACSVKGLLANMVAGGRYELQLRLDQRRGGAISKEDWVNEEAAKRTFFCVYVFYGLLTMTFNHTPAICNNEFDSLHLPCSESLWNCDLSDERFWREQLAQAAMPTFKEAQNSLFLGAAPRYSAFGARVMINALFLEVWQVKRSPDSLMNIVYGYTEKLHLALETWQRSLDHCTSETMIVSLTAPQRGPPLLFNAMAMYRATCARLEVDYPSIQEALRYHAPQEIAAAMTAAGSSVPRSSNMTKVIQLCFECFQIPALMGIRLFAKSSALNWSPEHIIFGFDLMLILSLWLHRLEEEHDERPATEEELAMLQKVKSLFDEDSVECGSKLSAAVAKIWGGMLDEVVVWGVTRTMGESFKMHAVSLEDDDDSGTMTTTTTSTNTPGPCSPVSHNDDMDL